MMVRLNPTSGGARTAVRAAVYGLAFATLAPMAPAQAQNLPLIRDTEIENLLNDYSRPIFHAAGLGSGRIKVRIIQNDAFNAFVLDGRNVFIHTGTLMQAQTPNEVIGVIAHESGHITGGHMAALRARVAKDQTRALLAQILGIGLLVAGGVAGGGAGNDLGGAGQGILYGGNEIVMRSLLAERRQQESAADQAGLTFLNATKQSGRGMLATFERFAQQEYISDAQKDAWARSHPLSSDRLARLRQLVESSPYYPAKDPPQLQLRHDLMRAKLSGYLERPQTVFNRYPKTDQTLPARYARAIARFFEGGPGALEAALADVDGLLREQPNNPYFWEVKGDLLMRAGKTREAIPPLRQAIKLQPDATLIMVQLASALQAEGSPSATAESTALLRRSLTDDENSRAYRLLANNFYKEGKRPQADAMIAQAYFIEGDLKQAQLFAKRAQSQLRAGSPEWLKNDDIINYKPET
jgi:predicted Zn-dependent protease